MTFEEIDLSEFPPSKKFVDFIDKKFYIWENYTPTTIEADIPFEQDWWKYVYWIPKIKKEFYLLAIKELDFNKALFAKCESLGIDFWFFEKYYGFFIKRLEWMRGNGSNHAGEVRND
jgi:hypothetical protein